MESLTGERERRFEDTRPDLPSEGREEGEEKGRIGREERGEEEEEEGREGRGEGGREV